MTKSGIVLGHKLRTKKWNQKLILHKLLYFLVVKYTISNIIIL